MCTVFRLAVLWPSIKAGGAHQVEMGFAKRSLIAIAIGKRVAGRLPPAGLILNQMAYKAGESC
jgi:hypothetical protein